MERAERRSFAPKASAPRRTGFVLFPLPFGTRPRRSRRIRFPEAAGSGTAPPTAARNRQLGRSWPGRCLAGSRTARIPGAGLAWLALRSFRYRFQQFASISALRRGRHACSSPANSGLLRDWRCGLSPAPSLHPKSAGAFLRPASRARGTGQRLGERSDLLAARPAGCCPAAPSSFRSVLRHRLRCGNSHRSPVRFTGHGTAGLACRPQPGLAPHRQCHPRCMSGDARSELLRRSGRARFRKEHAMSPLQKGAAFILCVIFALMVLATIVVPAPYARQFRDMPNAGPSTAHPLGTDALGRDSLSRLLYGTRVSLLLAPAAALLSTLIAALLGSVAGLLGGWFERIVLAATVLSLALPWLFLLLVVRAMLPLDVPPLVSVVIAFLMMGLLGWQASVRVICVAARGVRDSDFLLLARSSGCGPARLLLRHVAPNFGPLFYAQFWISIPLFILTEANLSILGLGVMEPMPSWGNLLRGFEDFSALAANPWRLVPLILLVIVVMCFQLVLPSQEVTQ